MSLTPAESKKPPAMISSVQESARFTGVRWQAFRLGLRLAQSQLGPGAIICFYGLWCLLGLILCLVFIPYAVWGKVDTFTKALNPVALYCYLLPMALMAAITWAVKLASRLLWCGIPEPRSARWLACAAVAGRLAFLGGILKLQPWAGPLDQGLLVSGTLAVCGLAWLGLLAEWGFMQTLRRAFISGSDPARPPAELKSEVENAGQDHVAGTTKKNLFTRQLHPGEWFERRFPVSYQVALWIILPLGYIMFRSMADSGGLQTVPQAILRWAVILSAIFQIFWLPGDGMAQLSQVFSQKTGPQGAQTT